MERPLISVAARSAPQTSISRTAARTTLYGDLVHQGATDIEPIPLHDAAAFIHDGPTDAVNFFHTGAAVAPELQAYGLAPVARQFSNIHGMLRAPLGSGSSVLTRACAKSGDRALERLARHSV